MLFKIKSVLSCLFIFAGIIIIAISFKKDNSIKLNHEITIIDKQHGLCDANLLILGSVFILSGSIILSRIEVTKNQSGLPNQMSK